MQQSEKLFQYAQKHIPGGVNSPVRAFKGVGGTPVFFQRGEGAYLIDADENHYIDYVCSWGPAILGHAHPAVVAKVQEAAALGLSFGAPTAAEGELAATICRLIPSVESVRLVNSGTEATMSAIRLARGFTGRNKILKFEGCYHGHSDSLLVKSGSGSLTLGVPTSAGVPQAFIAETYNATFNDLDSVTQIFESMGKDIAAIIVEPVAANMNCILPAQGFLQGLREICDQYGSLLIFDEVITGFRVDLHGAQGLFGVRPDITTLGKIIGGGLPVGAYGGRQEIMDHIAPLGPVYQAGTLSGNPIAVAAGLATLKELERPGFYSELAAKTQQLAQGLRERAAAQHVSIHINMVCGLFGLFFTQADTVNCFNHAAAANAEQFKRFFHFMLEQGVYLAPSMYEAGFLSIAHGDVEINKTCEIAERGFQKIV